MFELPQVNARLSGICDDLRNSENKDEAERNFPGLAKLLDNYVDPGVVVTRDEFIRRFLCVFRDSEDQTFEQVCDTYGEEEKNKILEFINEGNGDGHVAKAAAALKISPGFPSAEFRGHMHEMVASAKNWVSDEIQHIFGTEAGLEIYNDARFQNWGRTVDNVPRYTCLPTKVEHIQKIVQFAQMKGMSVRCAGFRHSWSPAFSSNGEILISLLSLHRASNIPNFDSVPQPFNANLRKPTELEDISIQKSLPNGNKWVRIGVSCTNERLRQWCIKNKTVTIPMNVIMVEITIGGSNAPICHGAGRRHKTLSDIVRRIEYVDANGRKCIIDENDPAEWLKVASGAFGTLGVVTHVTLELEKMSYAVMRPQKIDTLLAVPPPREWWSQLEQKVPPALFKNFKGCSQAELQAKLEKAQRAYEGHASDDYYCEWFWFPYADRVWVNCWNTTDDATGVVSYPPNWEIWLQFFENVGMQIVGNAQVTNKLIRLTNVENPVTTLISQLGMLTMPNIKPDQPAIKTWVPDGLHFRRAIQNVRVRDIEVEIPLSSTSDLVTHPHGIDYSVTQTAWWDAILHAYKHTKESPQRMPLEMRIMGGSDVVMAPQRGNTVGTCSIEILTLEGLKDEWKGYAQELLDQWLSYVDPSTGKKLNTRPHWAKEWWDFEAKSDVDGQKKPYREVLREVYAEEIKEFKKGLEAIAERDGTSLGLIKKRFGNEMVRDLFFADVPDVVEKVVEVKDIKAAFEKMRVDDNVVRGG